MILDVKKKQANFIVLHLYRFLHSDKEIPSTRAGTLPLSATWIGQPSKLQSFVKLGIAIHPRNMLSGVFRLTTRHWVLHTDSVETTNSLCDCPLPEKPNSNDSKPIYAGKRSIYEWNNLIVHQSADTMWRLTLTPCGN